MSRFFPLYATPVLIGFMLHPAIAQSNTNNVSLEAHAETVATLLEGKMDTTAQASSNPNAPSVRMTTCRIRVTDARSHPGTVFLYQEQALTQSLNQPYRQRFLAIAPDPDSRSVRSLTFKPANPKQWVGLCDQSQTAKLIQFKEIGSPLCSVFLRPQAKGYKGETSPEGCPTNVRGAVRITNQIELTPSGMKTWDRGFDAQGRQVWGAKNEAYHYQRINQ